MFTRSIRFVFTLLMVGLSAVLAQAVSRRLPLRPLPQTSSTGSWAASLPTPITTAGSAPTAYMIQMGSPWTAAVISTWPTN